jgi:hypothetical protein
VSRGRFGIQVWARDPEQRGRWTRESDLAECDSAEAVGVALVTLADDGEWCDDRKAAVWDRRDCRYIGGPPW